MANLTKRGQQPANSPTKLTDRNLDAWENSPAAAALKRMQANPRIKAITISAPSEACTVCQQLTGTYPKDQVPRLPIELCSHPLGCRAFYIPVMDTIFP